MNAILIVLLAVLATAGIIVAALIATGAKKRAATDASTIGDLKTMLDVANRHPAVKAQHDGFTIFVRSEGGTLSVTCSVPVNAHIAAMALRNGADLLAPEQHTRH